MIISGPSSPLGSHIEFLTSGSRGWQRFYSDSGALFLRIQNVGKNRLTLNDVAYVEVQDSAETARTRVRPGDVLLSITADLGRSAVIPPDIGPAYINQHLALIRAPSICSSYLAWYLCSDFGIRQIAKRDRGGVKSGLNFDDIKSLTIPLPPIKEQLRIGTILDKADAIRRKRQEAIALTEQLLRSTFLEMFGDPVTNPKRWPSAPLEELATIGSGVMKGRDYATVETVKRPYMRVANVQDGYLNLNEIKTIEIPESEADKYTLQNGDLLLTEGGDPDKLGRGAIWREQIPQCIHQNHIFRVRPLQSKLTSEYLSGLLGSAYGKRYFLRAAKQTTGIASINRTQLSRFPVLLPPLESQGMYSRFAAQHQNMTRVYQRLNAEADNLFNALVQRAFTGQL